MSEQATPTGTSDSVKNPQAEVRGIAETSFPAPRHRWIRRALALLGLAAITGIAGAAWMVSHHIVRTDKGVVILSKRFLGFEDSYVDARGWTYSAFASRPDVYTALERNGYGDFLANLRTEERDEALHAKMQEVRERCENLKQELIDGLNEWLKELEAYWGGATS